MAAILTPEVMAVPREDTLRSAWTSVEGLRIHYRTNDREEALPVVLVHGAAVSGRHMLPTAVELADRAAVRVPDLPGHGHSDDPAEVLDTIGQADAVAAISGELGLPPAVYVGNSFGCQIITALALRHPRCIAAAVLQGPTVDPRGRGWPRQLNRWVRNTIREGSTQPSETFAQWGRAGRRVFFRTIRAMYDDHIEERLPQVQIPTLVVRGADDAIVPQRWADEVTSLLPRGDLEVVADATHTMTVTDADRLADIVLAFRHRVAAGAP
jgi:2-hydroxy-6-oxonona-2,4-dienedioate hydrolase